MRRVVRGMGLLPVMAVLLWGCGEDNSPGTTVDFPGGDVLVADGNGAVGDGVADPDAPPIGPDGTAPGTCGDGVCGAGESSATCPKDCHPVPGSCKGACGGADPTGTCRCVPGCEAEATCCPDYQAVCGGDGCGDGQCAPGETEASCPADCKPSPGSWPPCVASSCEGPVDHCEAMPGCAEAALCLLKCGDDNACGAVCTGPLSPEVTETARAVRRCAREAGCFGGGGCGNGVCEAGESPGTCPVDCAVDVSDCFLKNCPDQVAVCTQNAGCANLLQCLAGCGNDAACSQKCAAQAPPTALGLLQKLVDCGQMTGCFGGCGDGQCGPGETAQSCPEDCADGPVKGCLLASCAGPYGACLQSQGCAKVVDCAVGCGAAPGCWNQCLAGASPGVAPLVMAVRQCGGQSGCFAGPGFCGDGQCSPGETAQSCPKDCGGGFCGDGKCAPGETAQSCPKDCGGGFCGDGVCGPGESWQTCAGDCAAPVLECLSEVCPDEAKMCLSSPICFQVAQCLLGCGASDGCLQQCVAGAPPDVTGLVFKVLQCGQDSGCFGGGGCGDGVCGPGESAASCPVDCGGGGSCANRCGQYDPQAGCQCDPQCAQFGDCCGDYAILCGGSGCGNGQCEPPFESPDTCPQDCSGMGFCGDGVCGPGEGPQNCLQDCGGPVLQCLTQCGDGVALCLQYPGCSAALQCVASCPPSDDCFAGCLAKAGPQAQGLLQDAIQCGWDIGCFGGPPPYCGDGMCTGGESSQSCPIDCGGGNIEMCLKEACPDSMAGCFGLPFCAEAVFCLQDCGSDPACVSKCAELAGPAWPLFQELVSCGTAAGCLAGGGPVCGNGQCEPGEGPDQCPQDCASTSCAGKCGQEFIPGAPCQCDGACSQFGDCCPDYEPLCGPVGPVCGNGACEEGEGPQSCPQDCGTDPVNCALQKCQQPIAQCASSALCGAGLDCLIGCASAPECPEKCLGQIPDAGKPQLQAVISCAVASGCIPGGGTGLQCLQGACADTLKTCQSQDGCFGPVACILGCNGDPTCGQACLSGGVTPSAVQLLQCGQQAGCL